jgi:hypothetical protein
MSEIDIHAVNAPQGASVDGEGAAAAGLIRWLYLAATPTFAIMALLTCFGAEDAGMMCPAAHGVSLLSGMLPMYVLMSAFHSAPWLKLTFRRRKAGLRHFTSVSSGLPFSTM